MPTSANKPTLTQALADLPGRVRVHELARRAGIDSKGAIAALGDAGVTVGSASSSVDREVAETVLKALLGGGAAKTPKKGAAGKSAAAQGGAKKSEPKKAEPKKAEPKEAEPKKAGSKGDADQGAAGAKKAAPKRAAKSGTAKADTQEPGSTDTASTADETPTAPKRGRSRTKPAQVAEPAAGEGTTGNRRRSTPAQTDEAPLAVDAADGTADGPADDAPAGADHEDDSHGSRSRRRRRGGRGRRRGGSDGSHETHDDETETDPVADTAGEAHGTDEGADDDAPDGDDETGSASSRRRRRRRRRRGSGDDHGAEGEHETAEDVRGVKGSTRLEAKRQRRRDGRDSRRRPQILSEAEFLARRESVDRVMAVRQRGDLAQVALLEDGVLVEHFVSQQGNASMIGNIYLGTVQNVLPSMEAAFVDIGKGRNAVLYAGEVNWDISGLEGKERRIETALSSGDTVLVQVSKDPIGHKGARLTTQISLPGRFLVFVPGGGATGISRKLPDTERKRLKKILDRIVPAEAGVIIRTAAEGVGEDDLTADVERLQAQWDEISAAAEKAGKGTLGGPQQLYSEPDTLIKVIRDLFNSDINRLLVDGDDAWASVSDYVLRVAPELADRVSRYVGDHDVFAAFRIDEQITKALQRKVRLPSGGSLVIDRTEAMTVVDVNTGKFTGTGGNLEETVTRNNLEAAEEIVRQLRLRDIGGIIVVDFIDMVLESNRDLVLRRLTECLGRDRTRHQVAEVTSLGLVQMTRKRMGLGLVEAFSEPCSTCQGRGIVLHETPADISGGEADIDSGRGSKRGRRRGRGHDEEAKFEPLVVDRVDTDAKPDPRGPKPPALFRPDEAEGTDDVSGAAADDESAVVEAAETTPTEAPEISTEAATDVAEPPTAPKRAGRQRRSTKKPAGEAGTSDAAAETAAPAEPPAGETGEPETARPAAKKSAARNSTKKATAQSAQAETRPAQAETESAQAETESAQAAPSPTDTAPAEPQPAESAATAGQSRPRRRRAAGRPAGAPSTSTTAVDIVLGG